MSETTGQFTVILPILPPSVNHMYALNRDGSRRLTDAARTFREYAVFEARTTANLTGWRVPAGDLALTILLTFGTRHVQDIDNRAKAALDALALALDFDDSRVIDIHIRRVGIERGRPLCELILQEAR